MDLRSWPLFPIVIGRLGLVDGLEHPVGALPFGVPIEVPPSRVGLVFTTKLGTGLDAANVRRALRSALKLVPGVTPDEWVPRELRHSFTSIMSEHGIPNEEIARVLGHSSTAVMEKIYRHELRPVIETTATAMDQVFSLGDVAPGWHMQPLFGVQEAEG